MDTEIIQKVLNYLSPVTTSGKILGIFPYKHMENGELKIVPSFALYSLLVFSFSIYNLFYVTLWNDLLSLRSETDTIAAKVFVFHKISEAVIFTLSIVHSFYLHSKLNDTVKIIFQFNIWLSKIDAEIDGTIKNSFIKQNMVVLSVWMLIFVVDYFVLFVQSSVFNISFFSWIFGNLTIMYNFIFTFQLSFIFALAAEIFSTINRELSTIDIRKSMQIKTKTYNSNGKSKSSKLWITARKRVTILVSTHNRCVHLVEDFHRDFNLEILLHVVTIVVAVTGRLYNIALLLIDLFNGKQFNFYILIHSIYWCALNYLKISAVIAKSEYVRKQVR